MKKIITNIVFATLVAITAISAEAIVKPETLAGEFFEGRNISIKGKNISTAVTLTTVDGQTFNLTGVVNKPANKLTLQLPLISQDSKVKLTFADKDGSTSVNIVVYNDTTLPNGGVDIFANATVLPASIETGIAGAVGPQGPEGPEGPEGPQGAPGSIPSSIPGSNVVGPVASAFTVLNATQSNITTLPALVSIGTNAIPTVFAGPITAPQGITGNIVGNSTNFTGNLAGDITGTQSATVLAEAVLFAKTLPAHAALAGVVTTGDSLEVAVEKLDGNVLANDADITAIQGVNTTQSTNISTLTSTLGAPTSANTANQIVKRDGSGNFAAGTITATSFVGAVTGNVTGDLTGNVTGNVTGNTSGSAATFTGALAGDVTGTQAATVLAPSVLYGKTLQASFVPVTGAVSIGDSLEVALEKTTGNITDTVNKTSTNASAITALDVTVSNLTTRVTATETAIGTPTALNTPNQIVKRDGSGNFAAGTVTATSFVGNLTGSATTATSFTGPLVGDVTGTQGATVIQPTALFAKQLQSHTAAAGVVATGDSLEVAIEKLDGNIGVNSAAITAIQGINTTQGTNITNLQNSVANLSTVATVDIDGLTSFAATSAVVKLDDTAVASPEVINTITGATLGQKLVIIFAETIDITDDDACTADSINIDSATPTKNYDAGDVLELIYVNGCWNSISESTNSI